MSSRLKIAAAILAVAFVSAWMVSRPETSGDYPIDAGPAINAVLHGDLDKALSLQPLMGSFSILVRLPFAYGVKLTGGEMAIDHYRLGAFPCVFLAGLLGLWLAGEMRRRGQSLVACVLVVGLLLVNPVTFNALKEGHPEEMLGVVLCIGALLAATRARWVLSGVMLGLALATKQWAVIAVLPVLAVAVTHRWRSLGIAIAIAACLTMPLALADHESFSSTVSQASGIGTEGRPFTIWRLVATPNDRYPGDQWFGYDVPANLIRYMHVLIVLLPIPLTYAFWRMRKRLDPEDGLLLLALLFLLRCWLDPVDNIYYHVPFIFSLAAWEGLRMRGIPIIALLASFALYMGADPIGPFNQIPLHVFYLCWALPLTAWLAARLYAPDRLHALARKLRLDRAGRHESDQALAGRA